MTALTRTVADKVCSDEWRPTLIAAIGRGGLGPTPLLAHLLDVKEVIGVPAIRDKDGIAHLSPRFTLSDLTGERILVLDTVAATCKLLTDTYELIGEHNGEPRTAALAYVARMCSFLPPRYFGTIYSEVPEMHWECPPIW